MKGPGDAHDNQGERAVPLTDRAGIEADVVPEGVLVPHRNRFEQKGTIEQ